MPPETPEISLIIPAHNESKAIDRTLNSIFQSNIRFKHEIIVACNGCKDDTEEKAEKYCNVKIVSSKNSGMSFGKNLGASVATGNIFIFIDADTVLPAGGLNKIIDQVKNLPYFIGTVAGRPDKGGIVVKTCFRLANMTTRKNKLHAPGGVMLMNRKVFEDTGGFNEALPQGTSTDIIMRARELGAQYVFINSPKSVTSIRRFEKTGIIWQMLDWRKNHKSMHQGRHNQIKSKDYKVIR